MNPFADWKDEQQCKGSFAQDASGSDCSSSSPKACKWCAAGRLINQGVNQFLSDAFRGFLCTTENALVYALNDCHGWTPAQFREAWDKFEASRAK